MAKENGGSKDVNVKAVAEGMKEYLSLQAGVEKAQEALEQAMAARSACVKRVALLAGKLGSDGKYRGTDIIYGGQRYVPMQRRERPPEDAGKDWRADPSKTTWYLRRDAEKPPAINAGG